MDKMEMNSRKYHLDLLKILAIWLVIFNHTGEKGFALFSLAWGTDLGWVYLAVSVICKTAVPLFWMCSGALLLGKREPLEVVLKKRVLRFVCVLVVFSMIQYLYTIRTDMMSFRISIFLTNLYTKGAGTTYWYLYAYLGYLFMLPFLRKIAVAMKEKEYRYLIILQVIVVGILPVAQEVFFGGGGIDYYPAFSIGIITGGNIIYPLIGYYLENLSKEKINKRQWGFLVLISTVSIAISCTVVGIQYSHLGTWAEIVDKQEFLNCFIILPTITIYYGARLFTKRFSLEEQAIGICRKLGEAVFSVMLIENILREQTEVVFIWLCPYLKTMLSTFVWVSVVLAIGIMIGIIWKRIPVIKKLI